MLQVVRKIKSRTSGNCVDEALNCGYGNDGKKKTVFKGSTFRLYLFRIVFVPDLYNGD